MLNFVETFTEVQRLHSGSIRHGFVSPFLRESCDGLRPIRSFPPTVRFSVTRPTYAAINIIRARTIEDEK